MLELSGVTKAYRRGEVVAVKHLSLAVKPGEIFGFLGPNGAGKTTTIKMMAGILPPDEGTITLKGIPVWPDPLKAKRHIGYVPDTPQIYPQLTGLEYLRFVADIYQVPLSQREKEVEERARALELLDHLEDRVRDYSHGMQQKLALIASLLPRPYLWILDEPMVGLDPRAVHTVKTWMQEYASQGNIVFFSTHILEVAERLVDRVGIIHHGELVAVGTLEELRQGEQGASLEHIFLALTES
ncbi:MAG: ABC transporter ATP-binding protein [Clostridiales bacterium]|nr:ABC transporter ATP-binding protein [Clostridiales bacterium]